MLEGLSLGSYIHGDSLLHNLDPRTKLIGALFLIIGTLVARSPETYIAYSFTGVLLFWCSGLPWRQLLKDFKFINMLLLLSFLVQSFTIPGEPVFKVGELTMTLEGIKSGAVTCWRLAVIAVISFLVTYTTTSINLSAGLEKLLAPLERLLGLPVGQLAMMMGMAISFIPVMVREVQSVIIAQQSRGAGFGGRNPLRQFRNLLPLLLPVIAGILRRADELSEAMEARCYRPGANRTRMKELHLLRRDWAALAVSFTLLAGVILIEYGPALSL